MTRQLASADATLRLKAAIAQAAMGKRHISIVIPPFDCLTMPAPGYHDNKARLNSPIRSTVCTTLKSEIGPIGGK